MCDALLIGVFKSYDGARSVCSDITYTVSTSLNYLGSKVDEWTHLVFPETVAQIVAKSIKALPVTVGAFFIPKPALDFISMASLLTQIIAPDFMDTVVGPSARQAYFRGLSDAYLVFTAVHCSALFTANKTFSLGLAIINGMRSFFCFIYSEREAQAG